MFVGLKGSRNKITWDYIANTFKAKRLFLGHDKKTSKTGNVRIKRMCCDPDWKWAKKSSSFIKHFFIDLSIYGTKLKSFNQDNCIKTFKKADLKRGKQRLNYKTN